MIVVAVLLLTFLQLCRARCPMGSVQGPSATTCYVYVSEPVSWLSAEEKCIQKGGHLTSVSSSLVNSFLSIPAAKNCLSEYWLGGAWNMEASNKWVWTDGNPFRYTHWAKGEPRRPAYSLCTAMDTKTSLWYGRRCYEPRPYICRVPVLPTTTTNGPGTDATPCPSVESPTLQTCPFAQPCTTPEPVTCPEVTCPAPVTCSYPSTDVSSLSPSTAPAAATAPTLPPPPPQDGVCPKEWTYGPFTHKCYKTSDFNWDTPYTWTTARSFCQGIGGDLPSIHGVSDSVWMSGFAQVYVGSSYIVPIGLTRLNGQFTWSDGSGYDYSNWATNVDGRDGHVYLDNSWNLTTYGTRFWALANESQTFPAVACQKKAAGSPDVSPPKMPPDPYPNGVCTEGWTYNPFSGTCYVAQRAVNYNNWTYWQSFCRGLGGDMPSIHSKAEDLWFTDFLQQYAPAEMAAVGAYVRQGVSMWSDGSAFDYAHWYFTPWRDGYARVWAQWDFSSYPTLFWKLQEDDDSYVIGVCHKPR